MKRKKEVNRKSFKMQRESQSSDFVDQEEMKAMLSGKRVTFSDDDDDDDIDIDIRDEEDEMSGNVGEDEVKKFIKKLGLDQFDGYQPVMDDDEENESHHENKKGKVSKKSDQKGHNKGKKERKPIKTDDKKKESVHVRFDEDDITSEQTKQKKKSKNQQKQNRKSEPDIPIQHGEVSSSSQASFELLIQLQGQWFKEMPSSRVVPSELPDETIVSRYQTRARELYEKEVAIYEKERVKEDESHSQWMKTVVSSGVMADKIAALGLQIQQAPVHTLQYLEQLLSLAKKKGRREAGVAVDALRHLFLEELIPGDRKLRRFEKHDFDQLDSLSKTEREKQLILWYYESQLKTKYETYVSLQQTLSYDTVVAVKAKAISTMYELLVNKPELEQKLLSQLVNKLGDPDYKVASKVVHWLKNLVKVHSQMKEVVVTEVEQLLYRPNISSKTQYYCICFLNQLQLSSRESTLAAKLITIYFKFFNLCMKKKKDTSDKILNALLTGVNRAYPYSKVDDAKVNEQMDLLFKVIHQSTFNTGLQAMMLLKQVLAARHTMNDRFYSALYRKLLDPGLSNSTHQAMFLNLIFQATKDDMDVKRIMAFIKRTLQICHSQLPHFICGALFMVSEVIKKHPRMLSTKQLQDESDDEEHFEDVKEEDDSNATTKDATSDDKKDEEGSKASGWIHKPVIKRGQSKGYDALARNPSFSGAERSILWELKKLVNHYHPSVSQFAATILSGESISYGGNPLDDFTLMRFLDRFVYKNPKTKTENSEKTSVPFEKKTLPSSGVSNVKSAEFLTLPKENVPLDVKFFHQYFSQKAEIENRRKEQEEENKRKRKDERAEDDDSSLSDEDSEASSVGDEEFEEIMEEEMERLMEESDIESPSEDEDDETEDDESGEELAEDLDFARDLSSKKKSKSGDSDEDDVSDFDEDWDEEDDDDDDEDADADEFEVKNDDEFDEEGFGGSDDDDGPPERKVQKKTKIKTKTKEVSEKKKGNHEKQKKKRKRPDEDTELQENADMFSSMIDENVSSKFDTMTMEALSNRDKAKWKQLEWEVNRDKWIRDRDTKTIVQAKKTKKRHRWFSKKKKPGKFGGKKK